MPGAAAPAPVPADAPSSVRSVPTARNLATLLGAAVGFGALTALVWWALLFTGAALAPLWTQAVGWPLSFLVRSELVQRLIGGGRLDNRVWLRLFLGCGLFSLIVMPTGMSFLCPLFATLIASVHLQWTGSRAWRSSVVMATGMTLVAQVCIHLGWQHTPLTVPFSDVAAVTALVVCVVTIANIALLAARRESEAVALEAERRAGHDELVHAATHDALTGRLNRAGLYQRLEQALAAGTPQAGTALLYLDLNGFKPVNDRYGHAAGDRLLQLTAQRVGALLRPGDHLARVGGDEFVAVLTGVGDHRVPAAVAERVDAALREPFTLDGDLDGDLGGDLGGEAVHVSASIGTAFTTDGTTTCDELLQQADEAMYAVKHARAVRR